MLHKYGFSDYLPSESRGKSKIKLSRTWLANICSNLKYDVLADMIHNAKSEQGERRTDDRDRARSCLSLQYPLFRQHAEKLEM